MNILRKYTQTLCCTVGLLAATLLAGCGGDQGRGPILGLPAATLVSLAVTPPAPSIALGASQQFSDLTATSSFVSATPASIGSVAANGVS